MQSLSSFRKVVSDKSYGIELECCVPEDGPMPGQYIGFFYVATDGSINTNSWNEYGREFVSQPLPCEWLVRELPKLAKRVGPWTTNNTCGIHVHVSKKWFTDKKATLVLKFLRQMYENHIEDYETVFGRLPNSYCRVINDGLFDTRYNAVNTTNTKTNEFRMFASGNYKWAQRCVKMADYLVKNCKYLSRDGVVAAFDLFNLES